MSTNSTLPTWIANLGTWVEIDAGRFIKAIGSNGTTGNANAINTGRTEAPLIEHTHTFASKKAAVRNDAMQYIVCEGPGADVNWTTSGSGGQTSGTDNAKHEHTPGAPAAYGLHIWVRTA